MVDYNKQVRDAIKLIDKLIEKETFDEEQISFMVLKSTGFGENFTKKYLKKALDLNYIYKDKKGIISSKNKKEDETK